MPNWSEVLDEISGIVRKGQRVLDHVRKKYLNEVHEKTGRNVIAYYSGWLHRPRGADCSVNDRDISGFMLNINKLDRDLGLDLILHTPGGSSVATEALVNYLKAMFGNNIRAIVPQISMSAGTMIAMACKSIIMGKHSSLGLLILKWEEFPVKQFYLNLKEHRKPLFKTPKMHHFGNLYYKNTIQHF